MKKRLSGLAVKRLSARFLFFSLICLTAQPLNRSLWALSSATIEAIGMYHVPSSAYEMVKGLGIDTVEVMGEDVSIEELLKRLDAVKTAGLKALTGIYRKPFEPLGILSTVNALKNHSAIAYWYIIDEPDLHHVQPDIVDQLNQFIHVTDIAKRPTFITISDLNYGPKNPDKLNIPVKAYSAYKDVADIIGVVNYQEPRKLRTYLEGYVLAEFEGRRWWAIVSLAQKPADLKKSVEIVMEGKPTGILYYAFSDEDKLFNLNDKPGIQAALREINFTLRGRPLSTVSAEIAVSSQSAEPVVPTVGGQGGAPRGPVYPPGAGLPSLPLGMPPMPPPFSGYPPGLPGASGGVTGSAVAPAVGDGSQPNVNFSSAPPSPMYQPQPYYGGSGWNKK